MNAYFEALKVFLLVFALIYTLAYFPGVPQIGRWKLQNIIFLLSVLLIYILSSFPPNDGLYWSFVLIFGIFNVYLFISRKSRKVGQIWNVIIDFWVFAITLFLASSIYALVEDLPIKNIIHERFEDGSYSFSPGYLPEMIQASIALALLVVNFKYIHKYLLNKWEERRNRKFSKLQSQKKMIEIQFDALQAKVNPHFLYNSLNSIAGLAMVDGDKTRQMALALSRFFRYSMNREQEIMISVKEEAEMIETYLEIEKIRFGDKLNYVINIFPDTQNFKIPRMLLQPIVENSIKHGMNGNLDILNIDVSFFMFGDNLTISVKDNGTPFPEDFIPGYGIKSVYEKLDLLFPDRYIVEIIRFPDKEFRVIISLSER
ncbi:sensor histidine kinase [Bacteroides sp. 519]|uniref:sensor histidine kinase n=1 Tax=Bacteroides sp. 519 TaxID=2302937 RepID=UPI0013D5AA66|nr:histidine kinase [Bacteroides sp. 519]NDV60310.1 hypothetical protein [Bacteroides sp. 519]